MRQLKEFETAIKVLYLEDNEEEFTQINEKIKEENIKLIWIKNPYEALEYLKKNKVDAVFVDLELTNENGEYYEMQGEDFAKKVNELYPHIPIFILSKYLGKSISYLGCYSKTDIVEGIARDILIQQLYESIRKNQEKTDFLPSKQWQRKWNKKWQQLKDSPQFPEFIKKVEEEAEKDIQKLEGGEINQSYRAYRTTKEFFDVLVSRRVLAYAYIKYYSKPGIVWWKLEKFLNMDEGAIKNFFFEVGLAWGSILNGKTLLKEEREWLQKKLKMNI